MSGRLPEGFVRVASRAEIPRGGTLSLQVNGREVALFDIAGELFAIEGTCPHQGAPLADGWVEGHRVTCPWHGWCFDVRTGRMAIGAEFDSVETYEVRVENGEIFIAIDPRRESSAS
ncbi:MAG TPA: non-heme iron oxygenase ferredoxin subunit [Candidatus Baltobacteraceae bacterium]|jgi:nitrite reductase/ring-hydroxylating ferredoxin subunit|nr:non-heme iron oxygenase ferredoxin subunit [Candidatus Baltobacteraceae bacterium]